MSNSVLKNGSDVIYVGFSGVTHEGFVIQTIGVDLVDLYVVDQQKPVLSVPHYKEGMRGHFFKEV